MYYIMYLLPISPMKHLIYARSSYWWWLGRTARIPCRKLDDPFHPSSSRMCSVSTRLVNLPARSPSGPVIGHNLGEIDPWDPSSSRPTYLQNNQSRLDDDNTKYSLHLTVS